MKNLFSNELYILNKTMYSNTSSYIRIHGLLLEHIVNFLLECVVDYVILFNRQFPGQGLVRCGDIQLPYCITLSAAKYLKAYNTKLISAVILNKN